jgi:CCR4-NOT transcription complex subunit 9
VQEITLIYPQLHPPELNAQASNRVCNALALFQCVASHSETRELFLQAQIPLFLYPFLNTTSKTRPFEYLRLTALGVIGALVKQDDSTVRFRNQPASSVVLLMWLVNKRTPDTSSSFLVLW